MHKLATAPRISSSKIALNALTVAMALELEKEGIKVNAVSPGFTKTTSTDTRAPRLSTRARAKRCALRYLARTAQQGRSRAGKTRRFHGDGVLSVIKGHVTNLLDSTSGITLEMTMPQLSGPML
jgi:NAD(P)-dependent dehydrogenase (short-subunit alcohol dehydrogenase family)